MDAQEILSRIKQQDKETFRNLITEYGKGLYLKLYAASGDPDAARQATKAAFAELYLALNSQQGPDVIESLLYSIGERKQREILRDRAMKMSSDCFDKAAVIPADAEIGEIKASEAKLVKSLSQDGIGSGVEDASSIKEDGDVPLAMQQEKAESGMGFWKVVSALLVIAGLWVVIGALMGDGYLPKYDLGYRWFNMNIANWFTWL